MDVGIDALTFYTPAYALPLTVLAENRATDPQKYLKGLGQKLMAIPAPDEDVVTLAANAVLELKRTECLQDVDLLIFATETGVDASKGAGLFVHGLLNLPEECRIIELKQACYSGAFGLQTAVSFIRSGQAQKALLITADIARYGLNSAAESSQGAAAVAMVITAQPRLMIVEPFAAFTAVDAMDFFRPNHLHEAIVDGHYSCTLYLSLLKKTWNVFLLKTGFSKNDFASFCFHIPVPRLVEKSYALLNLAADHYEQDATLFYSRLIGNCYSASIFVSLCSLLDHALQDLSDKRIGFYSYGSGAIAEFFSGRIVPGYQHHLKTVVHHSLFARRAMLTMNEYEQFFHAKAHHDLSTCIIPSYTSPGFYRLAQILNYHRLYEYAYVNQSVPSCQ